MSFFPSGSAPNYHPNSFSGPQVDASVKTLCPSFKVAGECQRIDTGDEDNFSQAKVFYQKVLDKDAKKRLISNIAGNLKDAEQFIQERAVNNFRQVDPELGSKLAEELALARKPQTKL